ncbi:MAG: tetratricopeptide repeat protein [Candidatus Schekmanbacteria bacterium]|nr:tetratricopeptide repeat protein [Candidatus Schekmanbacteria bacterium]
MSEAFNFPSTFSERDPVQKALALRERGELHEALEVYRNLLMSRPHDPELREEAIRTVDMIGAAYRARYYRNQAVAHFKSGNASDALALLVLALDIEPANLRASEFFNVLVQQLGGTARPLPAGADAAELPPLPAPPDDTSEALRIPVDGGSREPVTPIPVSDDADQGEFEIERDAHRYHDDELAGLDEAALATADAFAAVDEAPGAEEIFTVNPLDLAWPDEPPAPTAAADEEAGGAAFQETRRIRLDPSLISELAGSRPARAEPPAQELVAAHSELAEPAEPGVETGELSLELEPPDPALQAGMETMAWFPLGDAVAPPASAASARADSETEAHPRLSELAETRRLDISAFRSSLTATAPDPLGKSELFLEAGSSAGNRNRDEAADTGPGDFSPDETSRVRLWPLDDASEQVPEEVVLGASLYDMGELTGAETMAVGPGMPPLEPLPDLLDALPSLSPVQTASPSPEAPAQPLSPLPPATVPHAPQAPAAKQRAEQKARPAVGKTPPRSRRTLAKMAIVLGLIAVAGLAAAGVFAFLQARTDAQVADLVSRARSRLAGSPAEAAQAFAEALTLAPEQHDLRLQLARAYAAAGNLDKAIEEYDAYLRLNPGAADAVYESAALLEKLNRASDAKARYRQVTILSLGGTYRGEAYRRLMQLSADAEPAPAIEFGREAERFLPDDVGVRIEMARLMRRQKTLSLAVKKVEEAIAMAPDNLEARLLHSQLFSELDQLDAAGRALESIPASAVQKADARLKIAFFNAKGDLWRRQGNLAKALGEYRQAEIISTDDPTAIINVGTTLYRLERFPEAAETYRHGLTLFPNDATLHYLSGAALFKMGELGQARDSFLKATELRPAYAEAFANLGMVCFQLAADASGAEKDELRQQASDSWKKSLELNPDQPAVTKMLERFADK